VVKAIAEGQELLRYTKARAKGRLTRRKDEDKQRGKQARWDLEEKEDDCGGDDSESTAAAVSMPGRCRFILILTHCSILLPVCDLWVDVHMGREGRREGWRKGE